MGTHIQSAEDWAVLLADEFWHSLVRAGRRWTNGDAQLSEDLAGEVVFGILEERFTNGVSFPLPKDEALRYACGVLRNVVRNVRRRQSRMLGELSPDRPELRPFDAWQAAHDVERVRIIESAMASLTPRERELASLHWLCGNTVPEISDRLGISHDTCKELLRRARRKLRSAIAMLDGTAT